MADRREEINIKLSKEAKEIYNQLPNPKNRFVSEAIIEKWGKEHGEVFTPEQREWLRSEITRIVDMEVNKRKKS